MDIKQDLERFLSDVGWDVSRLVAESGANKDSIYRLLNGTRKGVSYKTMQKLWPFIYGDRRPAPSLRASSFETTK